MNRRLILVALVVSLAHLSLAETLPQRVEGYLEPRLQTPASAEAKADAVERILARPDPGTFFLRYAFGLKQHAKKLFTEDQTARLVAVIEKHSPTHSRWHDERNTLRCKFTEMVWRFAGASDADAPRLRAELETWMRLRMAWTQQEHLAQHRFARDVWDALTAEQQARLLAGDWKAYAKQDTGHARDDATAKIITRALGKPDHQDAFDAAAAEWSRERAALHAAVSDTENNERRIVFAMDLNSESLAHRTAVVATEAYAKLYLAEAEATRRIVRAGYAEPQSRCAQAATDAWGEAAKRFQNGAADLIQLLQNP